ncbi:MAG: right-handed parallel beta-helix repeat-containing protein [Rhodothermales bacterium]|nr:right-handed parallel beta-helix repeat-containing protein [Rhodothermales bacterium]
MRLLVAGVLALFSAIPTFGQFTTGRVALVDASGLEVITYEDGDQAHVRVIDADRNLDDAETDSIVVELYSSSVSPRQATLMETEPDSGTFEGEAELTDFMLGERVRVRYDDPADSFGNARTIRDSAHYGATLISGAIGQDTTWTTDALPIVVTGDILVPADFTLTVDPGVEVLFLPLTDSMSAGQDSLRLDVSVHGGLVLRGTESEPIRFASDSELPEPGDWYGILLADSLATVEVDHVIFEHARYGLFLQSFFDTPSDTVRVSNSTFRLLEETGLHSRYSRRHLEVSGNRFQDLGGSGVRVEIGYSEATGTLTENEFHRLGGPAISIDRAARYRIEGNVISGSGGTGIHTSQVDTLLVHGTRLSDNAGGIYLDRVSVGTVRANRIEANRGWGLRLVRSQAMVDSNLVLNNATEGWAGGIYVYTDLQHPAVDSLLYNEVTGNGGEGIHNDGRGQTVAHFNNVHSNTEFDFRNDASAWDEIDARFNWWGRETTLEISELGFNPKNLLRVFDVFDNQESGLLNYSGWLLENYLHEDSVRVVRPGATDVWRAGTSELIVWNRPADDSLLMDIVLLLPNGEEEIIASDVQAQAGSYQWQIDPATPGGFTYELILRAASTTRELHRSPLFGILPATSSRTVALQSGWNLVGVPHAGPRQASMFGPGIRAMGYSSVFSEVGALEPGAGYWLHADSTLSVTMEGPSLPPFRLPVRRGWNLFSGPSCEQAAVVDDLGVLVPGSLRDFDGHLRPASMLRPGRGYWLQATAPGSVAIQCESTDPAPTPNPPEGYSTLEVTSAGITTRIYLGHAAESPAGWMQPPLPASDMFDVRLSSGGLVHRWADGRATVQLQGIGHEVRLLWHGSEPLSWTSALDVQSLMPGQTVTVSGTATAELSPTSSTGLTSVPDAFEASLPYPNPSSGTFTIDLRLPASRPVTLELFDLLGRRVDRMNLILSAGVREVEFGAGRRSGVYLYRLQVGDQTTTGSVVVAR